MVTHAFDFAEAFRRLVAASNGNVPQELLPHEGAPAQQCLAVVQQLLLRPSLTLHVAAIFRPLLLRVVARLVEAAQDAPGGSGGREPGGGSPEAAVALVAMLDLAPQCERLVVRYFELAPAPFYYITTALPKTASATAGPSDAQLARSALRGLQLSPQLRRLWLWQWPPVQGLLRHADPDVRYCAVQCTALAYGMGDADATALARQVLEPGQELECAMRWHGQQAAFAAGRAAALLPLPDAGEAQAGSGDGGEGSESGGSGGSGGSRKRKYGEANLAVGGADGLGPIPGYVALGGVELAVMGLHAEEGQPREAVGAGPGPLHNLVCTPSVERNLQSVALGLCTGSPVLLEGPPGSGKSTLIEHIAGLTRNAHGMVRIHLDDQMDSKSLMGAYVCTARPGEFVWQPGPLTQAVSTGRWLLVEDINLAPAEVLAALLPLLERRTLHITARAETVVAAPGFQLLATVTSAPGGAASGAYGSSQAVKDLLGELFHYVAVEPPSSSEQLTILGRKFPALSPILPHAMATLALFQAAYGQAGAAAQQQSVVSPGGQAGGGEQNAVAAALAAGGLRPGELGFSVGRHFSLRDLAKWCARMATVHSTLLSRSLKPATAAECRRSVAAVPLAVREAAFWEAADCFCALLGRAEVAERVLRALCALWAVPPETVELYISLHKPAVQLGAADVSIGRGTLMLLDASVAASTRQAMQAAAQNKGSSRFAPSGHALRNMERTAVAASRNEPVLLVGETGTGKTTLVQQIAKQVGAKLVVLNLSQQTDSSDLLGGFRPVQPTDAVLPLLDTFADLVRRTWLRGNNDDFLGGVARFAQKRKWGQLVKAFRAAVDKVDKAGAAPSARPVQVQSPGKKKKKKLGQQEGQASSTALPPTVREEWQLFATQLAAAEATAAAAEGGFAFAFVEGALVRAVREGWWLLLDEVNLAPPEALERIAGLLEDAAGSLVLAERGDASSIPRHPNFRLFAAMNPATDAGKRDLPAPLRNRFTELWVGEPPHRSDLAVIVAGYLAGVAAGGTIDAVVDFYQAAKAEADANLQDGAGHKPSYNLRTLCRALEYAATATPVYGLQRALYDGFAMSFLTQLDPSCAPRLENLIQQHLVGQGVSLKALMRAPPTPPGPAHVLFDHFWVETGGAPLPEGMESDGKGGSFVLTPTIKQHLRNLARAVLLRRYPILLQGPTSSGKTSLVAYLAAQTGHTFVRINNHEQTDLQEYLGSYVSDESGRLVFREGLLVQAVRRGHWIVLDELNLAPTEVLEALNRLLDDNRELYVPELQETVKPHPHFMLFATQNPPGIYAGRKTLSRAFRSRFLELHVEDIPDGELVTILERRCAIAPSYASKLVAVMRELQRRRASSNVFAGRHGFITPRDLFRWASRGAVGYQALAQDGFAVLGERLRSAGERATVQEVLQKILGVQLDMEAVYLRDGGAPLRTLHAALAQAEADALSALEQQEGAAAGDGSGGGISCNHSVADVAALQAALGGLVWTHSMSRMYCLLERCLANAEPALLVGETGTGKTTVCQMAAFVRGRRLHIMNCNQHTEVSDFLGGFRPNRHRERSLMALQSALEALNALPLLRELGRQPLSPPATTSPTDLQALLSETRSLAATAAKQVRGQQEQGGSPGADRRAQQLARLHEAVERMASAVAGVRAPFEWVDGPLVEAMRFGDVILVDELNLAEDAVLERLNSVLEPGRTLTLAERGGTGAEVIVAHPHFRLVATMNPGGDYGKKELSPALSNRFTSIWVPAIEDLGELRDILNSRLKEIELREQVTPRLLEFWTFFKSNVAHTARQALSVRDLLAWAHFINTAAPSIGALAAYAHGAHLVLLDGIGLGVGLSAELLPPVPVQASQQLRQQCNAFLVSQLPPEALPAAEAAAGRALALDSGEESGMDVDEEAPGSWGIAPFFVERRRRPDSGGPRFDFGAPTTGRNALRVLRALQLRKPILLEGSPGVGKTSLVAAMAKAIGQELVRINLSEQTDMMDLLGADLPVEGGLPGEFAWSDGPLLRAIRTGTWVLLDELNLASQTVLEGLNAVLDHRAEVFIPELATTVRCPRSFRVFAAQNPLQEGGGRKGLPKSFLNRFMRVHVELLQPQDLSFIAGTLHPRIPAATLDRMVAFLRRLHHDANIACTFALAGGPWEFNLRDLLRWCELAESAVPHPGADRAGEAAALDLMVQHFAGMLFRQRLRTPADRSHAAAALESIWPPGQRAPQEQRPAFLISPSALQIGRATLDRANAAALALAAGEDSLGILSSQLPILECAAECVSRGWMCLLVGPPSSGKTAVVRSLSVLCGRDLVELALTSGTDTSDLLGGFEQVEPERKLQEVGREVQALVGAAAKLAFASPATVGAAQQALQPLAQAWSECNQLTSSGAGDQEPAAKGAAAPRQLAALHGMMQVAIAAQALAAQLGPPAAKLAVKAGDVVGRVAQLHSSLAASDTTTAGRFEWVDGSLTRAIETGQWVLLDNANLCNPTVLDRLNPLLEPHGELYINECGTGSRGPRVVRPHPDFRLFLALDPRHGEVSRAMRNRGIEIFLLPEEGGAAEPPAGVPAPAAAEHEAVLELEAVLGLAGIPGKGLPQAMACAHADIVAHASRQRRRPPSLRQLKRWAQMASLLAARGWDQSTALATAFDQVYVNGEGLEEARLVAAAAFQAHCSNLPFTWQATGDALVPPGALALFRPAAWPTSLPALAFASSSQLATILRDGSILVEQLARVGGGELSVLPEARLLGALAQCCQRGAEHTGSAASCLFPGPILVSALQGRLAAGGGYVDMESSVAASSAMLPSPDLAQSATLRMLAAAWVFAERSTPADLSMRTAWVAMTCQQALVLLRGIGPNAAPATCRLAQLAAKMVQGLVAHPVTAALAGLHGSLVAAVRLPGLAAGLLPVDAAATELLQPYQLGAGLPPNQEWRKAATQVAPTDAASGLWWRMQALGSQLHALRHCMEAAVLMQDALAASGGGAGGGEPATLLQLSFWRFTHPKERARRAASHPLLDWLYPLLHTLQAAEESLLTPGTQLPWSARMAHQLGTVQEWRWALLRAVHTNAAVASPAGLCEHLETLLFLWMRLRGAVRTLVAEVGASSVPGVLSSTSSVAWPQGSKLCQVATQLDACLGLGEGVPDKPYLWKHGGKPLLPRNAELCNTHSALLALCQATSVGGPGFEVDHRGQPAALARAGITLPALGQPADSEGLSADDRFFVAEAAAASVSCDTRLRSDLLEGLCLFSSAALTEGGGPGLPGSLGHQPLVEVQRLLFTEVALRAQAAAEAALALQQVLRSGQLQAGEDGSQQAGRGCSLVAVPNTKPGRDGDGTGGDLLEIMPPQLMQYASCRAMQKGLLALQDLGLAAQQLQLMGGGLLHLLSPWRLLPPTAPASVPLLLGMLRTVAQRAVLGGCCNVASVAPHQQLVWLLEAGPPPLGDGAAPGKWQHLMRQSLVHQAWHGFLGELWAGASGALPTGHARHICPAAIELWAGPMAGPMRLHSATLSAHATALAGSASATAIADRTAALLQLKLAGRLLRRRGAAEAEDACTPRAVAAAEWSSAAAVIAATLGAHLPTVSGAAEREEASQALQWLVTSRCGLGAFAAATPLPQQEAGDDAKFLQVVEGAFGSCDHAKLQSLAEPLLMPCLAALLNGTQGGHLDTSPSGLLARGRVWALLGLMRLHLAVPPAGTDPAAKYALLRQHALCMLSLRVEPELAVRQEYQELPGGPDESTRIAALERRAYELAEVAGRLEGRCVPRPQPPAYLGLREEVARFVEGFAAIGRVVELVEALSSSDAPAASQASTWQQNAGAWIERLEQQYSAYRDITHPVQVAAQEVRYGLSLMVGGAALGARPAMPVLTHVVATLLSYPRDPSAAQPSMQPAAAHMQLESSKVQAAVGELAATAARAGLAQRQGGEASEQEAGREGEAARMSVRLRLLRVALHDAAAATVACASSRAGGVAGQAAHYDALLRLHTIFSEFVGAWEEIKAEEERRASEEAELFKSKARSTDIASEEQEAEAEYQQQFPDHFSAFADLAADAEGPVGLDEERPLQAQQQAAQQQEAEQQAAAYSARELVQGEVLSELVALHTAAFAPAPAAWPPGEEARPVLRGEGLSEEGQFLLSYELGTAILRDAGLCLPSSLDSAAAGGHLLALALRHRQLSQPLAGTDGGARDLCAPCVEEAVLVQAPVQAVQARLGQLLEDWPGHPVLAQLWAIAGRILGMPVTLPLKQLLTGVELLLARAQVWEETAAQHVSLSPQLASVSALAARWRQLELASWRGLLQRTVQRFARGCERAWFHLYRILVGGGGGPVPEVAAAVEQFMQACPVGEFSARLQLLHSFQGQLDILVAAARDSSAAAGKHAEQVSRWGALSAVLYNVHRYYTQFQPHAERSIGDGLRQLEKELQDFVSLAKWEDRGYYAQRVAIDKAQRQLHRLSRRAAQYLGEPAGAVLTAAAGSMGFNDLAAPCLDLPEVGQQQQQQPTPPSTRKSKKAAKEAAAAAAALDTALISYGAAAAAVEAFGAACAGALVQLEDLEQLAPAAQAGTAQDPGNATLGGKYVGQLPRLTRRFQGVLQGSAKDVGAACTAAGAAAIDGLAAEAAERALALRGDADKGARARKKKALTDLLRALSDVGVSRRRSAVSADQRGVQAWFKQAGVDVSPLLASGRGLAAASSSQLKAGALVWAKADTYYYRSMARIQRLWEAAKRPHADLAPHEVESACRMSEHLMHLSQRGRSTLGALSACYRQLTSLIGLLSSLAGSTARGTAPILPQEAAQLWYNAQCWQLTRLASLTGGTAKLLRAAGDMETAAVPRALLVGAAGRLESVLSRLRACTTRLDGAVRDAVALQGGSLFMPPSVLPALEANAKDLRELHSQLCSEEGYPEYRISVPCWQNLLAAFGEAVREWEAAAQQQVQAGGPSGEAEAEAQLEHFGDNLEGAVAAALVWAQNARPAANETEHASGVGGGGGEHSGSCAALPLPALLQLLEKRMGLGRVEAVCTHATAALGAMAAAATAPHATPAHAARLAATLCLLSPMLRMMQSALCQLGLQYLAAHKASTKLAYVATSLFAGLAQEGFCMTQGEPAGEGGEGEGKVCEGSGLGEGDTRGAKDVSEQLEDQDQLLGAQQKGQQEQQEQEEQGKAEKQKEGKGIEMDDDFEGVLEDMEQDLAAQPDGEEGEQEEERLDQQLGDAGSAAQAVDERMWDEEDKEQQQEQQEDGGYDRDAPVQVEDKSSLDYAAGQEQAEEEGDDSGRGRPQAPKQQQKEQAEQQEQAEGGDADMGEKDGEQEEEEQQDWDDYPDRAQEQAGHVQPEAPEQAFELPEGLNLDGGEEEEEEEGQGGQEGDEQQQQQQEEQGPQFAPEQGAASHEEQQQQEEGAPMEDEPADREEGPAAGEEQPPLLEPAPQVGEGQGPEEERTDKEGGDRDKVMGETQQAEEEAAQQAAAEAGPKGLPSAVAAATAAQQGAGDGEVNEAEERDVASAPALSTAQTLPSGLEASPEAGGSGAGTAEGLHRDASALQPPTARQGGESEAAKRKLGMTQSNPYRSLGDALERWRARLAVTRDAEQQAAEDGQNPQVAPEQQLGEQDEGSEGGSSGEYRFLGQQEGRRQGDTQALAPSTEEQAATASAQRQEATGLVEEQDDEGEAADMEHDGSDNAAPQQQELAGGEANWGAGAGRKAGLASPEGEEAQAAEDAQGEDEKTQQEGDGKACEERQAAGDSYISAWLAAARLDDEAGPAWEPTPELSAENAQALRQQLDERLKAASEGSLTASSEEAVAHGREVWARCDALTCGLVGELAEQLRLILEPTLASRMAGDYRTGKRINMKKVIGYMASHFRKDKIWLRRTRPDKRRYQVVVAVDDSRSMAETGTGGFALEALTLICKAMARLEVGELGVVSFGGSGGVQPLHSLERPFTDADGMRIMSQMRFDQDNTIADRPMVDVISSLAHMLGEASARSAVGVHGIGSLHQLVLIVADGRFHEKESLRRMVREATAQPGVLYAFIVLDNPANSILDMQTVSFVGGKPVFTKYMDSFPFPLYIVLRDTAALPRTLADLLRQWFELSSA